MGRFWIVVLAAVSLLWSGEALAARKVALVIGNAAYTGIPKLTNPTNDARLIGNAAKSAGFEVVTADNLTIATFQKSLRDFRSLADGADVAMIYYAGHGMEGQGQNWLIPVNAKLETEFDLPYEAISLDRLLEAVSGARVRMLVLDACRNNPFGNNWKRGNRAVPAGLAGMELDDVLVLYAAAPGQVAADGRDGNSPFATSLARRLVEPGLALQLMPGTVRDDVLAATGGKQRPFVSASITGTPVYLVDKPAAAPVQAQAAPTTDRTTLDALMWQGALSANTIAGYDAYLKQFPKGLFAGLAKANLDKLKAPAPAPVQQPAAQPAPQPTPQQSAPQLAAAQPDKKPKKDSPAPSPAPALVLPQPAPPVSAGPAASVASAADPATARANAALVDKAPLPQIPPAPAFPKLGYPACREDFQKQGNPIAKVEAVNKCTVALDQYYRTTLTEFRVAMAAHQDEVSRLYSDKVGGHPEYTPASQKRFFDAVQVEHAASNPDGANFADLRAAEARYQADRAYLQGRYCEFTGCKR